MSENKDTPTIDCDECHKEIEVSSFPNAVLCCGCIFCCEECFQKYFEDEPLPKHQCDMCGSYHYGRYSIAFCSEDCMKQSKKLSDQAKVKGI